jgi:hypothetical protein
MEEVEEVESKYDPTLDLVKGGFYVFAPKAGSKKDLRAQYPELMEYPEFRSDKLKPGDALFVWFMRCRLSPWYDDADEKKVDDCIDVSYETDALKDAKRAEFENLRFPDQIKAAMVRMEKFNTHSRVEDYVYTKMLRESCKGILSKHVDSMDDKQQESWLPKAKSAWMLLMETTRSIEGGVGGVIEESETGIGNTEGGVKHFRKNRR